MKHPIPWILALALFIATPAWAHWNDSDLDNAFLRVTKRFKKLDDTLARKDRATARRISELERSVRELQTTVTRLERRLETANAKAARLEAAVERTSKVASAARTRPAGTPSATAAEPKGPRTEILGERRTVNGDFITLTGMVHNISDQPLNFVVVKATFLDGNGGAVKAETAYTSPRVVSPGAKATFKFVTRYDRRIRSHRIAVQTK